jgi:peptidoglycan/LPS O-acetylase OafA/YrhL
MSDYSKKVSPEFNYALHGLRGLAALIVYFAHSVDGYREHLCQQCTYNSTMEHLYFFGAYGVEMFFFLSGYVIFSASLKSNLKSFFSNRFWRIYPIFLFFTLFYFALNHFIQKEPDQDSWEILFYNLLFLNLFTDTGALSPNAWTITYEVWFYIMTFMFLRPFILKKYYLYMLVSVMLWGVFIWKFPICLYYLMGVAVNIGVRRYGPFLAALNEKLVNTVQITALCVVFYCAFKSDYSYHWPFMLFNQTLWLLMAAFVLFMVTLFHQNSWLSRFLQTKVLMFLGTISYTLYLSHPYSYLAARMFSQKLLSFGFSFEFVTISYIALNLIFTTGIVFFIFKFLENKIYQFGTGKRIFTPIPKIMNQAKVSTNA